jgi:hypothetical protein
MLSTPLVVASTTVALISYIVVYRLFFHPLSSIPGPRLARTTRLWLVWHTRKGKNHILMPALHKRYGPIVRIAPDQVLVCSEDAVRLAYSAGTKFTKGSWYQVCAAPGNLNGKGLDLLVERNVEKYKVQRRVIGPAYSVGSMEKHEHILDKYTDTYIEKLKNLEGQRLDLAEWTHIFALDALSWFMLSKSLNYTGKGHDGGNLVGSESIWSIFTTLGLFPEYVKIMHSIPKVGGLLMIPASLLLGLGMPVRWAIFDFCMPEIMKRLQGMESTKDVQSPQRIWLRREVAHGGEGTKSDEDKTQNQDAQTENDNENDFLATLMNLHHNKKSTFKAPWVLGIATTNFGAGHDTIMITLAGCIYHLATNPQYLTRLRADMAAEGITKNSGYTDIITKVPLFYAVLKESLRLIPAIGFYLPRVVPASGATVCNTYLPPGTTMGVNLWATQRDPTIFPDPESFYPERWLRDGTEEKKREIGRMDQFWMGFGGQSRSCPGQTLGRFFVIKGMKRLVEEFDMEVEGEPVFHGWFATGLSAVGVRFKEMGVGSE